MRRKKQKQQKKKKKQKKERMEKKRARVELGLIDCRHERSFVNCALPARPAHTFFPFVRPIGQPLYR